MLKDLNDINTKSFKNELQKNKNQIKSHIILLDAKV